MSLNLNKFPDRAVTACVEAMQSGRIAPRYVRDVLKYKGVDVTSIEPFLNDSTPVIRIAAIQIVAKLGNKDKIIDLLKTEEDKTVLATAIRCLTGKTDSKRIEEITNLLNNESSVIRNQVIEMYRQSGRADCLVGLLFDNDDDLVNRIKRYLEESENKQQSDEDE